MSGPYGLSALTYYEAGFSPLPAIGKLLKVNNASGRYPLATKEQIEKWTRTHGPFNVALRLPENVIGLDIDSYKGDLERLKLLEADLGELPKTWNSDSRLGEGGKLLYRLPTFEVPMKWQSNISGITVIQHTHRYVMVFPSHNKESNSRYQWYYGLNGLVVPDNQIPSVDDLAELPKEWVTMLRKAEVTENYYDNTGIYNDDLDVFNDGEPCRYMQILVDMCSNKLTESYSTGLHDTGLSIIGFLIQAAVDGHSGIQTAMDTISEIFCGAPRHRDLATEWNNLLAFVLANVDVGSISEIDACGLNLAVNKHIEDEVALLLSAGLTIGQISRRLYRNRRG